MVGVTLTTVACVGSGGTTAVAALDEAPEATAAPMTFNPLASSYVDTYQVAQTTGATGDSAPGFGDYIPGSGFSLGVDTSTIPGYEFIDQDSVNIGFLVCPLFFRDLSQ
jgi:hypothetical protein